MSDELNKTLTVEEPDPQALAERQQDAPGSFLDYYRSVSMQHVDLDEQFVEKSVIEGVVPALLRYGVMQRGTMTVYRGVVKSVDGALFYFNWSDGNPFKLVKADNKTKEWEANKLMKSCHLGCDMAVKANAPLDPGETVTEAYQSDNDEAEEDAQDEAEKAPAAVAPRSEEQWMAEQQTMREQVHPGSTHSALPDDPTQGRQWHEPIRRATDAAQPLATNDGQKHWSASQLMKAYGQQLQTSAPRVHPMPEPLEQQYMSEILGTTTENIEKGFRLSPRQRLDFEQWKARQLRGRMTSLQSWLGKGHG
jgi:hypothetical protein